MTCVSTGVGLRVLFGAGAEIDTTTSNGRLVFGIFASLAEFERELIAERTRAGLAAARARDRKGGRPRKMDVTMLRMAMKAMADRKTNASDLAKRLGITATTLYEYGNGDEPRKRPVRNCWTEIPHEQRRRHSGGSCSICGVALIILYLVIV